MTDQTTNKPRPIFTEAEAIELLAMVNTSRRTTGDATTARFTGLRSDRDWLTRVADRAGQTLEDWVRDRIRES
jgi:hypothetical protein